MKTKANSTKYSESGLPPLCLFYHKVVRESKDKMENKKMGRPSDNPRRERISIRLSDEEVKMLNDCTEKLNVTKTEIIARGIKKLYEDLGL